MGQANRQMGYKKEKQAVEGANRREEGTEGSRGWVLLGGRETNKRKFENTIMISNTQYEI